MGMLLMVVYYLGIYLEELRKTTENISHHGRCPGQASERLANTSEAITLELAGSVIDVNNDIH
jgi:hypothetical protein